MLLSLIEVVGSEFGAEAENATISKKRKPTSHESATRAPGYSSSRSLPPAYNSTHDNRPESAWPASSQQYFSDPLYRGPNDVSVGLSESSSSRQQNPSLFVNTLHDGRCTAALSPIMMTFIVMFFKLSSQLIILIYKYIYVYTLYIFNEFSFKCILG